MPNRIQGITVEIGGDVSGLSKALSGVDKQLNSTQKQLKDIDNLLKIDPGNTELLRQRFELLNNSIETTEKRLESLRETNESVTANDEAYQKWQEAYTPIQAQITRTTNDLAKLQAEQKKLSDSGDVNTEAYEKLQKSIEQAQKKLEDLNHEASDTFNELGRPISTDQYNALQREIIATEQSLNRLQNEARDTENRINGIDEKPIEQVEDAAEDAGDALRDAGDDASHFGDMLKAGAIVEGVSGLVDSMSQLADETREYQRIMGSLEVSSEKAGYTAEETADTYRQLYGVLGDDQTAATTTANLQALGFAQEDLKDLTNAAIGAWATYGDSIPIDGLAESINETIQAGQVTGNFADVLNWAGTSEDDFNAKLENAADSTERANIVMEELARQGLVEAGEAWQKNNESLVESNQAAADFQDTMAEMSERLSPVLTAVQNGINQLLGSLLDMTEGIDFSAVGERIEAGFSFVIDTVLPKLREGFQWILDNREALVTALVAIGSAISTYMAGQQVYAFATTALPKIISGFSTFFTTLSGGGGVFAALTAAINPVTLAIAGIAAAVGVVVGAFATLWNTSEEFRANITAIWNQLVTTFQTFTQGIVDRLNDLGFNFENIGQVIQTAWQALCDFLAPVFEGAFQAVATIFDTITSAILGVLDFFIGVFTGDWEQALNGIKAFWGSIWDGICGIFETIIDTLMGIGEVILSWFGTTWEDALNNVKDFFTNIWNNIVDIFSGLPGRMADIGYNIVTGIWNGISGAAGWLWNQISGFCSNIVNGIKSFFGINSPSKLMEDAVGKWLPPGIAVGFEDAMPKAMREINASMGDITTAIPQALGYGGNTTNDSHNMTYTFGPGSIVIQTQATNGDAIYRQLMVRMQQEVNRKGAAHGTA